MATSAGGGKCQVFPIRSGLTSFEHEEQAFQALAALLEEPVVRAPSPASADALLLCSGGIEEECLNLLRDGSARVLLAGAEYNAFAAGAEVVAWGHAAGVPLHLEAVGTQNAATVRCWLQAQRASCRIREAKLGLLGGSARWLVASLPDAAAVRQRFGVEVVPVSWQELQTGVDDELSYRKAAEASRWTRLTREAAIDSTELRRALGLSAALGNFVRQRGFRFVSLDCFQLIQRLRVTACLALADLNEEGIPAACEGDVVSALGMLLAAEVTGQVVWMANLAFLEGAQLLLTHCSAPPSLCATTHLQRHFETGRGVSCAGSLAPDQPVTLLRLSKNLAEAVVVRGTTRPTEVSAQRCRTQVRVELEQPLPQVLGNHHLLLAGDRLQPLTALCQLLGIRVL